MRLLLHLTGRHRTHATNRMLGLLLAFNAGAVNAGGFLVVHMYTSHMTGFLSMVADNLILGNMTLVLGAVGVLWAFMSGAGTTAIMVNWARHHRLRSGFALPLLLEAVLMLLFGLMGAITLGWPTPFSVPLTVLLLAFIMGLQNAVVTKMSSAQIRTTHMTGIATDLGIEMGKMLYWNRSGTPPESQVHSNQSRLRLFASMLGMFTVGGVVGAAGFKHVGFIWVVPLASILLALSLPPLAADFEHFASLWRARRAQRAPRPARGRPQGQGQEGRRRGAGRLPLTARTPPPRRDTMQTQLAPAYQGTPDGQEAEAILRKCVHCGFCTATCPTYQLLGDELDGPRGRIYLIKQVLEGAAPTRKTQQHLDRCLTCRNCETTCPSGVQYGHLVDIGRRIVDEQVPRPLGERALRWALKEGLPSPLFKPAMKAGQAVRGLLPQALRDKVTRPHDAGAWPVREHARKVLMLAGCVQPAMLPNINRATARVLDAVGIQTVVAAQAGCCGAVKFHLNDQEGGKAQMRANIDAWWPYVERGGVEAIVMNASGCGATVKDYGHILRNDAAYAERAARIGALTRDLSELLPDMLPELAEQLRGRVVPPDTLLAYHPPCTLQHAQKLRGGVETHLGALGFRLRVPRTESHLCCGSAGTYSVLNPELSYPLRDRKLAALGEAFGEQAPDAILSANVGCIAHLQSGTSVPVRHWVEVLDEALLGR